MSGADPVYSRVKPRWAGGVCTTCGLASGECKCGTLPEVSLAHEVDALANIIFGVVSGVGSTGSIPPTLERELYGQLTALRARLREHR